MDPLERLAHLDVPPVPEAASLRAGVRRKLNPRLLALHVLEFAVGATVWTIIQMSAALAAAFHYTLTGRRPERRPEEPHDGRSA